jgi:hypothetical protein
MLLIQSHLLMRSNSEEPMLDSQLAEFGNVLQSLKSSSSYGLSSMTKCSLLTTCSKKWPCNVNCSLCYCINETTSHLLIGCNFTEVVWNLVASTLNLPSYASLNPGLSPMDWTKAISCTGSKMERRKNLGILGMFWWTVWKERNRRIFDHKERPPSVIAELTVDLVRQSAAAYIHHPP